MKSTRLFAIVSILSICGACNSDKIETDYCPDDPGKTMPGICGCGKSDFLSDGSLDLSCLVEDVNDLDMCPTDDAKKKPGLCGCGEPDRDKNGELRLECLASFDIDLCPDDKDKIVPGACGCGVPDVDEDEDGVIDCLKSCPADSQTDKMEPGVCGCNVEDSEENLKDSDEDGTVDCNDECPDDANKTKEGVCGCGIEDSEENVADNDGDGVINCLDGCPENSTKTKAGSAGCDAPDSDGDGADDSDEDCPWNPTITSKAADGEQSPDCNYKDGIFEIWSVNDFTRLNMEVEKNILLEEDFDAQYVPCTGSQFLKCDTKLENHAIVCKDGRYQSIPVVSCVDALESDTAQVVMTKGAVDGTGEPKAVFESCTIGAIKEICSDSSNKYACVPYKVDVGGNVLSGSRIEIQSCTGGCTAVEGVVTCASAAVPAEVAETAGVRGQPCDVTKYKDSCGNGLLYRCSNGMVNVIECMTDCVDATVGENKKICAPSGSEDIKYKIHAKIMQDLAFSDAYKVIFGSYINPTPVNLYRVELDGNGKTIIASREDKDNDTAVVRPLFETVHESYIHDLILNYDLSGKNGAALANNVVRSRIDKVDYKGNVKLTNSLFGENYGSFGGLINIAEKTSINHVHMNGNMMISATPGASVVYQTSDVFMDDFTADLDLLNNSSDAAGIIYIVGSGSQVSNAKLSIKYAQLSANLYGFANRIIENSGIGDIDMQFGEIIGLKTKENSFYGFAAAIPGVSDRFDTAGKLSLLIDNADIGQDFYGVAHTIKHLNADTHIDVKRVAANNIYGITGVLSGDIDQIDAQYGAFKANSAIYGVFNKLSGSDVSANRITLKAADTESVSNTYLVGNDINNENIASAKLTNIDVHFDSVSSDAFVGLVNTVHTNASSSVSMNHIRMDVDKVVSKRNSYLVAREIVSGADKTITLNSISGRFGHVDGAEVYPFSSIVSGGTTNPAVSISNVSVYADAYTHSAEKTSALFADSISVSSGVLAFSNIATSIRLTNCGLKGEDETPKPCAAYTALKFENSIAEGSKEMQSDKLFWFRRAENEVMTSLFAALKAIGDNAETESSLAATVEALGEGWTTLKIIEGEDSLEIPWLK